MRKLFFGLLGIATLIFALPTSAFADTNNFYFSDSTFDYYLSKNSDNSSHMRVVEVLTAVFPSTDQNHGINRCIPYSYRGVDTLDESTFTVTRNGISEEFISYKEDDMRCFRIGSASTYVHGTQVYQITYILNNVILQPINSTNQELYWDTNGTGWYQNFKRLSATIHLSQDIAPAFLGQTSCYVGVYGTAGNSTRCKTNISEDKTEITFTTENLAPTENLTFDLEFQPETFYVKKDYSSLIAGAVASIAAVGIIIRAAKTKKLAKTRNADKLATADNPKPAQYVPYPGLSVAQAKEVWMSPSTADSKVASLMELAVHHKIELEKTEKESSFLKIKTTLWKIHVKNLDDISREQITVLEILNKGNSVKPGDIIDVEAHSYSSKVAKLVQNYAKEIKDDLISKGLFESDKNKKTFILAAKYNKYEQRTIKGIEASNYFDGLKDYISLAEKERIKFLHSVEGADVSNQGIVKLYEKLLPYAIIFGCEDSWLKELNKYYQMPDVDDPDWLPAGMYLSSSDFNSFRSSTMSTVSTASASSDSGGYSGGGGGGSSGGGGGGGGGGGW